MRAIILAAGYATRLHPLTETVAKPLLPVGGRPIIDRLLDSVMRVPGLDSVHVVTNARFAPAFRAWADSRAGLPVHVHDDGTTSEADRLGAIGDLGFVLDEIGRDDDLLVVAGDNLFAFELSDLSAFAANRGGSALAVYEHPERELLSQYGIVELGSGDRITGFVEKPSDPVSNLVATAAYVFTAAHAGLIPEYRASGGSPDQPGRFVAWLQAREAVYGFRFTGEWIDIGDLGQLLAADNGLRRAERLPERDTYSID